MFLKRKVAKDFEKSLYEVMLDLSKQVVLDGEGAKKFLTIKVSGASNDKFAKEVAMSIANSPLVKTALAGSDPNWGRILMAIGKTNERVKQDKIEIKIGDFLITKYGMQVPSYDELKVKNYMLGDNITFDVNLNLQNYLNIYLYIFFISYIWIFLITIIYIIFNNNIYIIFITVLTLLIMCPLNIYIYIYQIIYYSITYFIMYIYVNYNIIYKKKII